MQQIQLVERRDGFDYDYRMRCDCGRSSPLRARAYADEINHAHMDCQHCGADIHFGRAVIAIRDEKDPALGDEMVPQLAWYHTSTWPDWPSRGFAEHAIAQSGDAAKRLRLGREHALEQATISALHLGTYEAAIENMLRRMHDQADHAAQFYLYRIRLRPDLRIEAGYRDENLAEASRLTAPQLEAAGLDVVRYLNAYEAEGTLSLAVRPAAVAAVQEIAIPVIDLVEVARMDDRLDLAIELAEMQCAANSASVRPEELTVHERKLITLGLRPGPDDVARLAEESHLALYAKWHDFEDELARLYLRGVSPTVTRDINDALGTWRRTANDHDPAQFTTRYRQMAALLTESEQVIRLLAAQPWRDLPATA
ncbi:hypothetical protein [Jiangella muralis]|uniref:hypothetical protein n=1 Tax=Jiangella muralis TaxID=702383 RepID=UPI00069E5407|nr:hypothetical protein [Jiangella muralis]